MLTNTAIARKLTGVFDKFASNGFFRDSFWSLTGNVVARGLAMFSAILTARMLNKDLFGEYGLVRNNVMTIAAFSTMGLAYTGTQFLARLVKDNASNVKSLVGFLYKTTFIFSTILALVIMLLSTYISGFLLGDAGFSSYIKLTAIIVIFNAITFTQIGIISGFGEFKLLAKLNSIVGFFSFIATLVLTCFLSIEGAVFSILLVMIFNCFINHFSIRSLLKQYEKESGGSEKHSFSDYRSVISASLPVALQEAIYSISNWVGAVIMISNTSFGEFGLYNAAIQWNSLVLFIPSIMRNVMLAHFSRNSQSQTEHSKILKATLVINGLCTILPTIFILLFASQLAAFYGESFSKIADTIVIVVAAGIFMSLSNVYSQAFMSLNKNWLMFFIRAIRDVSVLCFLHLFLKFQVFKGANAMAFSLLISTAIFLVIMSSVYYFIKKKAAFNMAQAT